MGGKTHASLFDAPVAGVMSANELGLNVSSTDGSINLANSVRQGLFGSNPHNGDTKAVSIYYRLGDASRHSLLKSTVIIHYYNTLADVPVTLLASCQASQQAIAGRGAVLSTESDAVRDCCNRYDAGGERQGGRNSCRSCGAETAPGCIGCQGALKFYQRVR